MGKLMQRLTDAARSGVYRALRDDEIVDAARGTRLDLARADLRGAPDKEALLERLALALGFPGWFGGNWTAGILPRRSSWRSGRPVLLIEGGELPADAWAPARRAAAARTSGPGAACRSSPCSWTPGTRWRCQSCFAGSPLEREASRVGAGGDPHCRAGGAAARTHQPARLLAVRDRLAGRARRTARGRGTARIARGDRSRRDRRSARSLAGRQCVRDLAHWRHRFAPGTTHKPSSVRPPLPGRVAYAGRRNPVRSRLGRAGGEVVFMVEPRCVLLLPAMIAAADACVRCALTITSGRRSSTAQW